MKQRDDTSPDDKRIEEALIRAGQRAREEAARWGNPVVVWKDGKIVKEYPGRADQAGDAQGGGRP